MDENVHFSLSMKVANALIEENKDFDMLIVPNTDHSGACVHSSIEPTGLLPHCALRPYSTNACLYVCAGGCAGGCAGCAFVCARTGVRGPYAVRRMWDYFVMHLQGIVPPKEYVISGGGEQAVTH